MPRVENLGNNVSEFCEKTGEGSSSHNVCNRCYKFLEKNPHSFNYVLKPYNKHGEFTEPQGTEGWAGDVAHPPYAETGDICKVCRKPLSDEDDFADSVPTSKYSSGIMRAIYGDD